MDRVWKDRVTVLWRWFSESEVGFVPLLLAGFIMMGIGVPIWICVFLLVTAPFPLWAVSNRRWAKEMAGEPFTFCLPGYRESLRRSRSVAAVYSGFAFIPFGLLLSWLESPRDAGLTATAVVTCILSAFCLGAAVSLCINVDFRFVLSRRMWSLLLLLSVPLFVIGGGMSFALILFPPLGISLGLTICIFMWIRLGDMGCVKRGHRMIIEDALDRRSQAGVTRTGSPSVEHLFLHLAEAIRSSMTATHLWGGLYRTFGLILSYWKWLLFSVVGAALVLGYTGEWKLFIALGLLSAIVHLPVDSGILLPEGRREKQRLAIAVAAATTLLLTVAASLVVALSWCLVAFMPHVFGTDYGGIAPWNIALPSVVIPWIFVLQLLDHDELSPVLTSIFRAVALSMTGVAFLDRYVGNWTGIPRPLLFATVLVAGWAFLLPILRHVCTQGHLAGQGLCVE
jgi:hypothetical protein